jgi:thymidylate synthase
MVKTFDADNFDVLFKKVVHAISENPQYICEPRGQKVKEILAPTLVLRNPRARLLNIKARKADYGFGVGEFLWYWNGREDLESLLYYNKRAAQFSDDGKTVNSAYGFRIGVGQKARKFHGTSQWEACKKTLLADNDSRRALLIINNGSDQLVAAGPKGSKDVPCTLSFQFFIRNNRLILHSHMRSNDVIWGLTYDLFSFTLLQEMMMLELNHEGRLGLDVGEYIHTAGSLHLYEPHFKMAQEIGEEASSTKFRHAEKMERLDLEGLALLAGQEESLRLGKVAQLDEAQFSGGTRWMAIQLNAHRRKRDAERER